MKNFRFHLISWVGNFLLIFTLYKSHSYIIDEYIDELFFIRVEENFIFIYVFSMLVVSFFSTFLIYLVQDYRKHFYVILLFMFMLLFLVLSYDLIVRYSSIISYYQSFFDYLKNRIFYILIRQETLISVFFISITIYYAQMFMGKKILSTKDINK